MDTVWRRRQDEVTKRMQREQQQAEESRRKRCGPKPKKSPWDGAIVAAKNHVEATAHDPDSIEFQRCTEPRLTDGCWMTTCTFRGKNAFGAMVRNRTRFYIGRNPHAEMLGKVIRKERL